MATLYREETFDAPAAALWSALIDWGGLADWFPDGFIEHMEVEGEGDGAVRIITPPGGAPPLRERLDGADGANLILQLSIVEPMPDGLLYYKATGRIIPSGDEHCTLTWSSAFKAAPDKDEQHFADWFTLAVQSMFAGLRGHLSRA